MRWPRTSSAGSGSTTSGNKANKGRWTERRGPKAESVPNLSLSGCRAKGLVVSLSPSG